MRGTDTPSSTLTSVVAEGSNHWVVVTPPPESNTLPRLCSHCIAHSCVPVITRNSLGQVVAQRSPVRLSVISDFIWKVLNIIGLL